VERGEKMVLFTLSVLLFGALASLDYARASGNSHFCSQDHEFGYPLWKGNKNPPSRWPELCQSGRAQSPINIKTKEVVRLMKTSNPDKRNQVDRQKQEVRAQADDITEDYTTVYIEPPHNDPVAFVIKKKLPWKNAQKACQDRGGDLLTVRSPADQKDLIKNLDQDLKSESVGPYPYHTIYYVGAKKADVGGYKWVKTGKVVSCASPFLWSTRPTSSCKGGWARNKASCLAIAMGNVIEPTGAFIDMACEKRQYILCEK